MDPIGRPARTAPNVAGAAAAGLGVIRPDTTAARQSPAVVNLVRIIDTEARQALLALLAGTDRSSLVPGPGRRPTSTDVPWSELAADHRGAAAKAIAVDLGQPVLPLIIVTADWRALSGRSGALVVEQDLAEAVRAALGNQGALSVKVVDRGAHASITFSATDPAVLLASVGGNPGAALLASGRTTRPTGRGPFVLAVVAASVALLGFAADVPWLWAVVAPALIGAAAIGSAVASDDPSI
jgi:hypothetical protein